MIFEHVVNAKRSTTTFQNLEYVGTEPTLISELSTNRRLRRSAGDRKYC